MSRNKTNRRSNRRYKRKSNRKRIKGGNLTDEQMSLILNSVKHQNLLSLLSLILKSVNSVNFDADLNYDKNNDKKFIKQLINALLTEESIETYMDKMVFTGLIFKSLKVKDSDKKTIINKATELFKTKDDVINQFRLSTNSFEGIMEKIRTGKNKRRGESAGDNRTHTHLSARRATNSDVYKMKGGMQLLPAPQFILDIYNGLDPETRKKIDVIIFIGLIIMIYGFPYLIGPLIFGISGDEIWILILGLIFGAFIFIVAISHLLNMSDDDRDAFIGDVIDDMTLGD